MDDKREWNVLLLFSGIMFDFLCQQKSMQKR